MVAEYRSIAVLGAGAWGTALAVAAKRAGRDVALWAREPDVRAAIAGRGENTPFLPGIRLTPGLALPEDAAAAAAGADAVLLAAPAQHLRQQIALIAPAVKPGTPLVVCAKGLERGTGRLMTEIVAEAAPDAEVAILSGPSFAEDVVRGLPTAVTLAARTLPLAEKLASALASPSFRPYANDDPVGAAIGGAVKNVLAIACGIAEGKGFGASARAALIARGFAEMRRFGLALGAKPDTLTGLAGFGDLILTCTTAQSRNFAFGLALGSGESVAEADGHARGVVEGEASARPVVDRAAALGVDMPIAEAVAGIVDGLPIETAIAALLARPLRPEHE